MKEQIISKINSGLQPLSVEVVDESSQHAGHAAMQGLKQGETHFHVKIVSNAFQDKTLLERHRMVYQLLEDELKNQGVHALSIVALTPDKI